MGLALLFAPLSGEETREWLVDNAENRLRRIRRQARRWVYDIQDVLDKSEDRVAKVLRTGKNALDSLAARLDGVTSYCPVRTPRPGKGKDHARKRCNRARASRR